LLDLGLFFGAPSLSSLIFNLKYTGIALMIPVCTGFKEGWCEPLHADCLKVA
jgi:hypothetical protein